MFSDIPPALQHNILSCHQNQRGDPSIEWRLGQMADCYWKGSFIQRSHQQSYTSNWQYGDRSATQERYTSDTIVISGCNPLMPQTVCLQNPNNPNMFHSYNVGNDSYPSRKPQKSFANKQTKQAKRTKEEESEYCKQLCKYHIEKAVAEICQAMEMYPKSSVESGERMIKDTVFSRKDEKNKEEVELEEQRKLERCRRIFPKWHRKGGKISNRDEEEKNENKSLTNANYEQLSKKIDTWAKLNCHMIRDISKKLSDHQCCQCRKHQDDSGNMLPSSKDLSSEVTKEFKCFYKEYIVSQYEEMLNFMHTSEVKIKPKKSRITLWQKIKQRIKIGSVKEQNEGNNEVKQTENNK